MLAGADGCWVTNSRWGKFSFSRVCSFTAGCGLCWPHVHGMSGQLLGWVALLAPRQGGQNLYRRYSSRKYVLRETALICLPPSAIGCACSASQPGLQSCRVWDTLLCSVLRVLKPHFLFLQSFRKAENVNDKLGVVTVMFLPKGERWDGMCVGYPSLGAALLCYSSTWQSTLRHLGVCQQ